MNVSDEPTVVPISARRQWYTQFVLNNLHVLTNVVVVVVVLLSYFL